jgi:DNA polymerase sigma
MRGLFSEDKIFHRAQFCLDGPEVVWPSWGNKGTSSGTLVQSIEDTVLQDHLVKISQLSRDQHPDAALPVQPPDMLNGSSHKASLSLMHNALHEEIDQFCKQVAAGNLVRRPYINWAVKRVTRCLQVLWPRSRTNLFGSNATGLALPTSDVDLVVSLPPVRNLEPIKEAGILEGRNGIKETCLQHAARCLTNQDWVRSDSLKTVENTAIPVIMLVADVPCDTNTFNEYSSVLDSSQEYSVNVLGEQGSPPQSDTSSSEGSAMLVSSKLNKDDCDIVQSIRLDISFKSPSHTGLQTTELVRELTQQFPAVVPLALILKKFLADRSLDHPYSGGLSSYCLVLLIVRFLQHEHHLGRPINQNLGSLLMDFLYFFGNIFDPRHMRISIQGSGIYLNRERGHSIDPIHIDDPLCPANNVGRNCFRIHQCIKAFADAFAVLENELLQFSSECSMPASSFNILKKIIPSIDSDGL